MRFEIYSVKLDNGEEIKMLKRIYKDETFSLLPDIEHSLKYCCNNLMGSNCLVCSAIVGFFDYFGRKVISGEKMPDTTNEEIKKIFGEGFWFI